MDRNLDSAAFNDGDAWRMAALSMMGAEELRTIFAGNPASAAAWVIAAANGGLVEAELRFGRMLLSGEGVPKDERAAFEWFGRAAAQGDSEAHNMLGRCCENGWGTAQDFAAAARHYEIAAQAGDTWAQYNLGHLYLDGLGVARDRGAAFALYIRAAEQGHVRAMNLAGRCCEQGWGVARDPIMARAWYRKSAEGGYFRGAYNYASMIAGEGCIAGAAIWFEKALATAPEPSRSTMMKALSQSLHAQLRAVALGMIEFAGAGEGLI